MFLSSITNHIHINRHSIRDSRRWVCKGRDVILFGKRPTGSPLVKPTSSLTVRRDRAGGAAASQTEKVKAETSPENENSASPGSRSTSLNNPPKKNRSKKVGLEEEEKQDLKKQTKKRDKNREVLPTSVNRCKGSSSGIDFFFFFCEHCKRKKLLQSTKLNVRNVKLPGACVCFSPGSRIPH